jgi:hypothetical protein
MEEREKIGISKHGEELGKMNAELIKALQANRERRRAEREEEGK